MVAAASTSQISRPLLMVGGITVSGTPAPGAERAATRRRMTLRDAGFVTYGIFGDI
jgi:hypothetical protein